MKYGDVAPVVVILLVLAAGWFLREPLLAHVQKQGRELPGAASPQSPTPATTAPAPATPPQPHRETVYRWVDAEGVTHFSQSAGPGREAVEIDPARIQSLHDLTPSPPSP